MDNSDVIFLGAAILRAQSGSDIKSAVANARELYNEVKKQQSESTDRKQGIVDYQKTHPEKS